MEANAAARVLVVNAGSSSLKLRVLGGNGTAGDDVTASADLPAVGGELGGGAGGAAIKVAIESFGPVDAVGHRVVHGGTLYTSPVIVTREVRKRLESLTDLAPLHQPKSLAAHGGQVRLGRHVVAYRARPAEHAQLQAARPGVHHEDAVRREATGVSRLRSG